MSNLQIDPDNYSLLITDNGGAIYNTDDKSTAISFSVDTLRQLVYNSSAIDANTGLLYPVVRFFDSSFRNFIVERPPSVIRVSDDCEIKVPWQLYVLSFDSELKLKSAWCFFRPFSAITEEDDLYVYPAPFVNSKMELLPEIIDEINNYIEKLAKNNTYFYALMAQLFQVVIPKYDYKNQELDISLVPSDLASEEIKDFNDFGEALEKFTLDKFLFVDFKKATGNLTTLISSNKKTELKIKSLIKSINSNSDKNKPETFLDFIKKIVKI